MYLSCMKSAVKIQSDDIFNDPSWRQSLPLHYLKVVIGLISLALFLILAQIESWFTISFLKSSEG